MARDEEMLFDKACQITASAVRGAMGGADTQPAAFVGDVFRKIYKALQDATDSMPGKGRTGF